MGVFLFVAPSLATLALVFFMRFYVRPCRSNQPSGPKPWPIIGNLNLIGPLPHRSIHELSQKYGPIMQLQLGSFPFVVASSVEMARQFLKVHDLNFASRSESKSSDSRATTYINMVWDPYGTHWRLTRKLFATQILNTKKLCSYEYIRVEERQVFLSEIYVSCGLPITLRDHLSSLTLNIISRVVLGKKFLDKSESYKLLNILKEWFILNGMFNIRDFIPFIKYIDWPVHGRRIKALSKDFDRFLEHELVEHIARRDDRVSKDFLDVLLQVDDDDSDSVLKLTPIDIKSMIQDLLGGSDSSSFQVEWAMSELLIHPKLIEQATEELDRVIGRKRWVEERDIENLPYIRAIAYETMRMHPLIPMLTPRFARENCKIHGYDIAQGTQVLVNTWSIGRDPRLWESPNEFRPERFIGRDIDVKGQQFELLPFGSGRRMCPGYPLGIKLLESGLANLLHGFNWKLPNNKSSTELNMDEVFGLIVPRKVPLVAVAQPRLPLHLYQM